MPKRSKEYAFLCSTPCPKIVPNPLDLKCKGEGLGSVNGVPTSEHDGKHAGLVLSDPFISGCPLQGFRASFHLTVPCGSL